MSRQHVQELRTIRQAAREVARLMAASVAQAEARAEAESEVIQTEPGRYAVVIHSPCLKAGWVMFCRGLSYRRAVSALMDWRAARTRELIEGV